MSSSRSSSSSFSSTPIDGSQGASGGASSAAATSETKEQEEARLKAEADEEKLQEYKKKTGRSNLGLKQKKTLSPVSEERTSNPASGGATLPVANPESMEDDEVKVQQRPRRRSLEAELNAEQTSLSDEERKAVESAIQTDFEEQDPFEEGSLPTNQSFRLTMMDFLKKIDQRMKVMDEKSQQRHKKYETEQKARDEQRERELMMNRRVKHIDLKYHNFLREAVNELGKIKLGWVQSEDQLADILTKPLQGSKFKNICGQIIKTDWALTTMSLWESVE